MEIKILLDETIKNNASDLHLLPGMHPAIRVDGVLKYLTSYSILTPEIMEQMIFSLLKPDQKQLLLNNKELDFSFGFGGGAYGDLGRFRTNLYFQRGVLSGAFRFLRPIIPTIEELKLPKVCHSFAE
ncbi:MAG: type IV pili twitching motility protein PilT, partial [Patescibacteria group bacterium]